MFSSQHSRFKFTQKAISFTLILLVATLLLPTSVSLLGEIYGESQHLIIEKAIEGPEERNEGPDKESLEDYKVEKLKHTPFSHTTLSNYLSFTGINLTGRYRSEYLEVFTPPPEA